MKPWHKIFKYGLISLAGIALLSLSGCQSKSNQKTFSTHENDKTEKTGSVNFDKSNRVWYVVDSDAFNKYQQKTIPDFVAITKNESAKVYRTNDYGNQYVVQLDGQYRDQKKFVDLGTYSKMNTTQIKHQIGISDQAEYQINKLWLEDDSSDHSINAYQTPQFTKFKTKINHLGETVTVPNGLRPKIMNDASPSASLDQDDIDFTFDLGKPLTKAITINHQKYIGYRSQNGQLLYLTKQF